VPRTTLWGTERAGTPLLDTRVNVLVLDE
jgi:hypothetical protein